MGTQKPKIGPKYIVRSINGKKLSYSTAEFTINSKAWLFYK